MSNDHKFEEAQFPIPELGVEPLTLRFFAANNGNPYHAVQMPQEMFGGSVKKPFSVSNLKPAAMVVAPSDEQSEALMARTNDAFFDAYPRRKQVPERLSDTLFGEYFEIEAAVYSKVLLPLKQVFFQTADLIEVLPVESGCPQVLVRGRPNSNDVWGGFGLRAPSDTKEPTHFGGAEPPPWRNPR